MNASKEKSTGYIPTWWPFQVPHYILICYCISYICNCFYSFLISEHNYYLDLQESSNLGILQTHCTPHYVNVMSRFERWEQERVRNRRVALEWASTLLCVQTGDIWVIGSHGGVGSQHSYEYLNSLCPNGLIWHLRLYWQRDSPVPSLHWVTYQFDDRLEINSRYSWPLRMVQDYFCCWVTHWLPRSRCSQNWGAPYAFPVLLVTKKDPDLGQIDGTYSFF